MGYREPTYTEFTGHIDGYTQKAVRFMALEWPDYEWVPRKTKNGDPIIIIESHDDDSKEATVKIADWLCDKNGWRK